jgi:hypothetical protein
MQPQTSRATAAPVPPTMIGGEIPLIDVSGYLAGEPGAAQRAASTIWLATACLSR